MDIKKVAIACQGGGTHAAFTWGVLLKILETKKSWEKGSADGRTFDIIGISGTSAGALCALASWYGLVPNKADPECGTTDKAIERLNFLWSTFAADTLAEIAHNATTYSILSAKEQGIPIPFLNPYGFMDNAVLLSLAAAGARAEYLGWSPLLEACCPHFNSIKWDGVNLRLLVGAIEVISGNFEVFDSDKKPQKEKLKQLKNDEEEEIKRWRMLRPLSLKGVAASGTLPQLLKAQRIENLSFPSCGESRTTVRDGFYWDGLYSQNPPVRDFLDPPTRDEKPDEIWVIRINPQECVEEPHEPETINDRENELAGNISLNQELDHILMVNKWLRKIKDNDFLKTHKPVTIRTIKMTRDTAIELRHSEKFNRSSRQLTALRDEGLAVTESWLTEWRAGGDNFSAYPCDARYSQPH